MNKINSKELSPGLVLALDVLTENNNILLEKGTILTGKDLAKLAFYAIPYVYVEEEDIPDDGFPPDNGELTSTERLRRSKVFKEFKKDFESCAQNSKRI